ncbi:MAG: choice-of-anchor E domain-containing protein [Opitutaceae bacterium]
MKAVSVLLLAAAGLVPALGYSQTSTTSTSDSYWSYNTNPLSNYLDLEKFDSTLGTLQSVQFNFSVQVTSSLVSLKSYEPTSATAQVTYDIGGVTTTNAGTRLEGLLEGSSLLMSANDYNIVSSLTSTSWSDVATLSGGGYTNTFSIASTDAGLLSDLTGTSRYGITINDAFLASLRQGAVELAVGTNGLGILKESSVAGYSVTAVYTYAIPEPATYALVFGALTLGLVGWRRFRK